MEKYKEDFIKLLVHSGALKFGNFTLKSGRKCPYFLNIGQIHEGDALFRFAECYAAAIHKKFKEYNIIFGPAYKGISLAVAVCITGRLYSPHLSYSYNRKEVKDHGEGGMLVGAPITKDSKIVIVDDVITAGTALRETLDLLKKFGPQKVVGVMIAVDRMEKGRGSKSALQEIKEEFGIDVFAIVTLDELVEYLYKREIDGQVVIDDEKMAQIKAYRAEYGV